MKHFMKELFFAALIVVACATTVVAAYSMMQVATGTVESGEGFILTFSSTCKDLLMITNKNSETADLFVKINDGPTTSTTSTSYDFIVPRNSTLVLGKNEIGQVPVKSLGVYTTATTAAVMAVGK